MHFENVESLFIHSNLLNSFLGEVPLSEGLQGAETTKRWSLSDRLEGAHPRHRIRASPGALKRVHTQIQLRMIKGQKGRD
jgi:hypothetical protein